MKIAYNKKMYLIPVFIAIFLPGTVWASNVYIDTSHQDFFVGDIMLFSVRVDSENQSINAAEGNILLDYLAESASLIDINTSGSGFSLWPGKPLPSASNANISFAGGSPGGLNSKNAIIFNFVLKLQRVGRITLIPSNFNIYLNDGKGTKDKVSVKSLALDVSPKKSDSQPVDDWNNLTSNDRTPPEPFDIYPGQEGSVFDGKKFLSFSATDEQSGIAYYEVTEGGLPTVRSSGTYVLRQQDRSNKVTVIAYDASGNLKKETYTPKYYYFNFTNAIIITIALLVMLLFVKFNKRKKNARIK